MSQSRPFFHVPTLLILLVLAILTGAGIWIVVSRLQDRPDSPLGVYSVDVNGLTVQIEADPTKQVRLVENENQVAPEPVQPVAEATAVSQTDLATPIPTTELPAPTATAVSLPATPLPTADAEKIIFINYVVGQNDTLYSISSGRMDTSIALMAQHNIAADHLIPGTTIELPVGNPAYCVNVNGLPYAVREGDTAFSVSKKCGTTVDILKDMNDLNENYLIKVADIICVPNVTE